MEITKIKSGSAFTLVELVVVITILAILGTVGFLSLQGYSTSARDSARISDLANLSKAMDAQLAAGKLLPQPNAPMVTLTASGTTVGYQGCAGSGVLGILGLSGKTQDPLNGTCYTYETNAAQNRYQVLSLQENASQATAMGIPLVDTAYAGPYDTRVPATRGNQLGILLWTGANLNQPAQEYASSTGIDLAKTTTGSGYVMVFSNSDTTASVPTSGSGAYTGALFTFAYNRRDDLLGNKALAAYDPSLVGYWDMETTTLSGSQALLKDLSGYRNDGACYNGITPVSCGTNGLGPQLMNENGKTGGMMRFNGANDTKIIASTWGISPFAPITVSLKAKFDWFSQQNWLVFIDNSTCNRYLFSSTWKWSAPLSWSHVWTCAPNWSWWIATSEDVTYYASSVWYSIIFVVNPMQGYTKVFRDGQLIQSMTYAPFSQFSGTPLHIWIWGNNEGAWYATSGIIDEVRIYNRALSDIEIQSLYNATK